MNDSPEDCPSRDRLFRRKANPGKIRDAEKTDFFSYTPPKRVAFLFVLS